MTSLKNTYTHETQKTPYCMPHCIQARHIQEQTSGEPEFNNELELPTFFLKRHNLLKGIMSPISPIVSKHQRMNFNEEQAEIRNSRPTAQEDSPGTNAAMYLVKNALNF